MAKDLQITLTLATGKDISFTVPESQAGTYFDGGDATKPKTDALFKLAEQAFPKEFEAQRSLQSANRYYQGPGKVTVKGATAPPTPTTSPKPKPVQPASPPTQAQIDAYARRWFKDDASGSIPYQVLNQYRLSPNRANFQFPRGFSEVGKEAVKRESARIIAAQRASERQAQIRAGQLGATSAVDSLSEKAGAGELLLGKLFPTASRRMTAAVTGQQASEAEPLGLYPAGKLTPARGFTGTLQRTAGELLTPEAMATIAATAPLAPLVASTPALGLVATLAGVAQPAYTLATTGDVGKAGAEALMNFGPTALAARPAMQAMRGTLINRMASRAAAMAGPTRERATGPFALPAAREPFALPPGPNRFDTPALPATPESPQPLALPAARYDVEVGPQAQTGSQLTNMGPLMRFRTPIQQRAQVAADEEALSNLLREVRFLEAYGMPTDYVRPEVVRLTTKIREMGGTPEYSPLAEQEISRMPLGPAFEDQFIPSRPDRTYGPEPFETYYGLAPGMRALPPGVGEATGVIPAMPPTPRGRVTPTTADLAGNIERYQRLLNVRNQAIATGQPVPPDVEFEIQRLSVLIREAGGAVEPGSFPAPVQTRVAPSGTTASGDRVVRRPPPKKKVESEEVLPPEPEPSTPSPVVPGAGVAAEVATTAPPPAIETMPPPAPAPAPAPAPTPAPAPVVPPATATAAGAGATVAPPTPKDPVIPPSVATPPEPVPTPVAGATGATDALIDRINRDVQRAQAILLGIPEDQIPARGSMSSVQRQALKDYADNPSKRQGLLEDINSTNWDKPESVIGLGTVHQAAALDRLRELQPQIESGDPNVVNEYTNLMQAIIKIGSRKGYDLAMQRWFRAGMDFSDPNVAQNAAMRVTQAMQKSGASSQTTAQVLSQVNPKVTRAQALSNAAQQRVDEANAAAEEILGAAAAAGLSLRDKRVILAWKKKLNQIGTDRLPSWAGQSEPLLAPAVKLFRDGVRSLGAFERAVREKYGEDLPDELINELFRKASVAFAKDNKPVDDIITDINRVVTSEAWKSKTTTQRNLVRFKVLQNLDRLMVLGLDLGIFGTQLGLAGSTRAGLFVGSMPKARTRSMLERVSASAPFIGGASAPPSFKGIFTNAEGGGIVPATVKSLLSEKGALAAENDMATLANARYSEFDNPFQEAGLFGFREQDVSQGALSTELSLDMAETMSFVPKFAQKPYQAYQRATETGLRYARAMLFDQFMAPYANLPKADKLERMKGVANFVNTLTGGGTYTETPEKIINALGFFDTAPRYYASNAEMGILNPLTLGGFSSVRAASASGNFAKNIAPMSRMVATEYGRMILQMVLAKKILEPMGYDVVADPRDQDFGNIRWKTTDGIEEKQSMFAGREKFVPLAMNMIAKVERPASGAPGLPVPVSNVDRLQSLGQFQYGKSAFGLRTVIGAVPYKLPKGSEWQGITPQTLMESEYRGPGGQIFQPSDMPRMMKEDPQLAATIIMSRLPFIPLASRQMIDMLPYVIGNGNDEEGRRILAWAMAKRGAVGSFGVQRGVSMTPEMARIMAIPGIASAPPAEREKIARELKSQMGGM